MGKKKKRIESCEVSSVPTEFYRPLGLDDSLEIKDLVELVLVLMKEKTWLEKAELQGHDLSKIARAFFSLGCICERLQLRTYPNTEHLTMFLRKEGV